MNPSNRDDASVGEARSFPFMVLAGEGQHQNQDHSGSTHSLSEHEHGGMGSAA